MQTILWHPFGGTEERAKILRYCLIQLSTFSAVEVLLYDSVIATALTGDTEETSGILRHYFLKSKAVPSNNKSYAIRLHRLTTT